MMTVDEISDRLYDMVHSSEILDILGDDYIPDPAKDSDFIVEHEMTTAIAELAKLLYKAQINT